MRAPTITRHPDYVRLSEICRGTALAQRNADEKCRCREQVEEGRTSPMTDDPYYANRSRMDVGDESEDDEMLLKERSSPSDVEDTSAADSGRAGASGQGWLRLRRSSKE